MITTKIHKAAMKEVRRLLKAGDPRALTLTLKSNPYPLVYRMWREEADAERKRVLILLLILNLAFAAWNIRWGIHLYSMWGL